MTKKRPPEASAPLAKLRTVAIIGAAKLPSLSMVLRRVEFPLRAPTVPLTVEPPKKKSSVGVDYDTEWARKPAAMAVRKALQNAIVSPVAHLLADPQIDGLDRLDGVEGPVIFAVNHQSHLDTPLMLTAMPKRFRNKLFVVGAADYFFTNRLTSGASALVLNAIPIERAKVARRSAAMAAELMNEGWSMLIFPEGGRSPDGWGQPFKGGAAYLAVKAGMPVVPVHLWGTDRLLPKGTSKLRTGSTVITFGRPLVPTADTDARRFGEVIEAAVAALGDEATSDWYSARRRAHAGETPGLSGPDGPSWRRTWALGTRTPHQRGQRPRQERSWPTT